VAAGLTTTFASTYAAEVSLPGVLALDNLAAYAQQATGHKYLIRPDRDR
jgi:NADPH:quinone reductase